MTFTGTRDLIYAFSQLWFSGVIARCVYTLVASGFIFLKYETLPVSETSAIEVMYSGTNGSVTSIYCSGLPFKQHINCKNRPPKWSILLPTHPAQLEWTWSQAKKSQNYLNSRWVGPLLVVNSMRWQLPKPWQMGKKRVKTPICNSPSPFLAPS